MNFDYISLKNEPRNSKIVSAIKWLVLCVFNKGKPL